ncbi:cation-translocating P-type ATPase [Thomasclavelia sp.]|uniref:cation-translocating P-type ATPase n=1 Tax=Thomasclavelia sp. TaxID=3025757 RepID=UPI0025E281C9|nr:cation-translocating P-type ATPase [Thomasclavelia sp.]
METYQKTINQIQYELNVSNQGLDQDEIETRIEKYGKNEIIAQKEPGIVVVFFNQFKDILVIILIVAALISAFTGELESTLVIIAVVTLNAVLGTVQTIKARRSLDSLKELSIPKVKVIRSNKKMEISADELTVGDLVLIEAGDIVAGDGRLKEANNLQINESALTGESVSVEKQLLPINHKCTIGDMNNMVFSGSLVSHGTGSYIVTAVGMETQMGKIATMLNEAKQRLTPLQKSLDEFSIRLSIGIILICIIVLIMDIFFAKEQLLDALMVAVALAVAAIPEALGSIVTIVLSISTQKMVKENAIIKDLNAVESLGCVSVICCDKTGTLTQNKMTAVDIYTCNQEYQIDQLDHRKYNHQVLLKSFALCNNATVSNDDSIGDPTEIALLQIYQDYCFTHQFALQTKRILELPFDSSRKLMSVTSNNHLYTKGAPEVLLNRCKTFLNDGYKELLTKQDKKRILQKNEIFASQGKRVLAFAYKKFYRNTLTLSDEYDLVFIGLVSLIDPPRLETLPAVKECIKAGIKPIMITGDHATTACSIANTIGIFKPGDRCLEGKQLDRMSDYQLYTYLPQISVYARVAPEHKIRIVKAWQKNGAVVAMTGDGVNDAPALKQSDVGVAMGITGSEVAKDGASMILTDDNFATIVKAIMTGRIVYTNIKNAIIYLLSGNLSAIICVLITSFFILPTPFLPVHLLFINLITDSLPAIAIGMEKGNDEILQQRPRNVNESLLNLKTVTQIIFEGIIISIFTMLAYFMGLRVNELTASSMAFGTLCLARLCHGFNCRSDLPLIKLPLNYFSIAAFLAGFLLLLWILISPNFHSVFSISELSLKQLALIFILATLPSVIIQINKLINSKHNL